jgi:hypothetical protein
MSSSSRRLHSSARATGPIAAALCLALLGLALPNVVGASPITNKEAASSAPDVTRPLPSLSGIAGRDLSRAVESETSLLNIAAAGDQPRAASPGAAPTDLQLRGSWTGSLANDPAVLADDLPAGGETLRETLRSLATMHRADVARLDQLSSPDRVEAGRSRAPWSRHDGNEEATSAGLSEAILDSDVAADAVKALVEVKSTDALSTTFSVLGLGDFVLEATPGGHVVTLTELSTGLSATLPVGGSGSNGSDASSQSRRDGEDADGSVRANVNHIRMIVKWIVEFLESPLGFLLTMLVCIMSLLWVMTRTFAVLGRMTTRSHSR